MQALSFFLEQEQTSLVGRFFQEALRQKHLANTFVLLGPNPETMIALVQTITAVLNCSDLIDESTACGACQNCRWIANNAHPGFMTLINWDPEAEKVKQGIQVEQFNELLSELSRHSGGFKRVVVLVGCHDRESSVDAIDLSLYPTPLKEAAEAGKVTYAPLDKLIFSDKVANKLLKTLEEPPNDTHFFIITDSERKLLETILSRAQVLRIPTQRDTLSQLERSVSPELEELFNWLMGAEDIHALGLPVRFAEVAEAMSVPSSGLLRSLLDLAEQRLPQYTQSAESFKAYTQRVALLDKTRIHLESHVKEEIALEELGLALQTV